MIDAEQKLLDAHKKWSSIRSVEAQFRYLAMIIFMIECHASHYANVPGNVALEMFAQKLRVHLQQQIAEDADDECSR